MLKEQVINGINDDTITPTIFYELLVLNYTS